MSEPAADDRPIPHRPRGLPPSAFRLDGRRAVVTGGSKNIGLEIAAAFLQAGAEVLIAGRKPEQLESALAGLGALVPGGRVEAVRADIGASDGADAIADAAEGLFGGVDILVNNAHLVGATPGVPVFDIPEKTWYEVFETNLFGPIRLINRLMKPVVEEGRTASVINVLSGAAFKATPGRPAYSASKAALWMLTRCLAEQAGPAIRVNAVCPGVVTEYGEPRFELGRKFLKDGMIPLGRLGLPEEVSAAALYLASDAASYTTGSVIHCNGGRPW
ncbi:NAD(P)-dependent dehydrogenase (short-subunit alcohol dehydrogenase family) [Thermocatellispora tengchongensis]|uniref:NAD(P)-dependent dehydrogenase (Short-subunit alcohol dehydrogenase family) n=1 Tax=Thermocatellispora tengchongensis TaxID=1073253 RepID=A0A840PIA6_9ACTN|nr:SDR family oxidoreductase [Thermocatellispora tengchongensis]MBB5136847.1 NAD(P)-dependent dehydrogenase (short-subunit alcohol dehydrogenase family) [Thermocatellispora tengchongensis]